jgi:hypothetical protein
MKLTVSQKLLDKAIKSVNKAVPAKALQPILNNIYLKTQDNKLLVNATDLDFWIEATIPSANLEEGSIAVSAKKIEEISSKFFDEELNLWRKHFFLKSDCVRYHRNPNNEGNTYIANISLDKTIQIPYADKTLYFMSHEQRFNAGYVYSLDEHRYLDLKVTDKNMFGDLVLIRKANDKMDYVAKKYSTIYESMISSLVRTRNSVSMSQCPSKRFVLFVTSNHEDVVTCFISNGRFLRNDCRTYYVANDQAINEDITIAHTNAIRLNRGHRYEFTMMNGYDMEFIYSPITHDGIHYFDMQSAIVNGYVDRTCSVCGSTLDAQHDADVCARRNHKVIDILFTHKISLEDIKIHKPLIQMYKAGINAKKGQKRNEKIFNFGCGRLRNNSSRQTVSTRQNKQRRNNHFSS